MSEKRQVFISQNEGILHRFRGDTAIYLLLVKLQAFHYMLFFFWELQGKHIKCVEQENRRETAPEEMKLSGMTRKYIDLSLGSVNLVELCKARELKEEERKNDMHRVPKSSSIQTVFSPNLFQCLTSQTNVLGIFWCVLKRQRAFMWPVT